MDDALSLLFRDGQPGEASPALRSFARQVSQQYRAAGGSERRTQVRFYRCIEAVAVPIDRHRRQVAEPMRIVTRDVSRGGVAICLPRMVTSHLLALQLHGPGGATSPNVVQVIRCRPTGMFFEAAGPFVSLLTETDLQRALGEETEKETAD